MRKCLFCDNRATSLEHVWPDWSLEILASIRKMNVDGVLGDGRTVHFGGTKAELTSRCVCDECNHGWMGSLEAETRPILGPLIRDVGYSLKPVQQFTVALWAIKTSMVMEAVTVKGRERFYSQDDRIRLKNLLLPPPHSQVWIGRYIGGQQLAHWGSDIWDRIPKAASTLHAYVNTIAMGRIVIQVLSVRRLGSDGNSTVSIRPKQAAWDNLLHPILVPAPSKSIHWPPPLSFDDAGKTSFEFLHDRWLTADVIERDGA